MRIFCSKRTRGSELAEQNCDEELMYKAPQVIFALKRLGQIMDFFLDKLRPPLLSVVVRNGKTFKNANQASQLQQ